MFFSINDILGHLEAMNTVATSEAIRIGAHEARAIDAEFGAFPVANIVPRIGEEGSKVQCSPSLAAPFKRRAEPQTLFKFPMLTVCSIGALKGKII